MTGEIDLAILLVAEVLFGVVVGCYSALQLVAYGHADDEGDAEGFTNKLLERPIANYFALGLGRVVLGGAIILVALRFAVHVPLLAGTTSVRIAFVLLCVGVPVVAGNAAAFRSPGSFLQVMRFAAYPVVYLFYPLAALFLAGLKRFAPGLLDTLAFPMLSFKRRLEIVGYSNGDETVDEQDLVTSVFEFHDTKVREIMVPRIDMVAVNIHLDVTEAIDSIIESGHSRVPVFDESVDRVVGVIHTKDLLRAINDGETPNLSALNREAYFVPESKKIDELLAEFRARRIHIAIVVDEYGGTAGLITLEDIMEELVGDIQDEHDTEEALIQRIDADSALCSSRVRIDELTAELGIVLDEVDAETLGGYFYENFGRVPSVGAAFAQGDLVFKVQSVHRQRIDKVLITGLRAGRSVSDNVS